MAMRQLIKKTADNRSIVSVSTLQELVSHPIPAQVNFSKINKMKIPWAVLE